MTDWKVRKGAPADAAQRLSFLLQRSGFTPDHIVRHDGNLVALTGPLRFVMRKDFIEVYGPIQSGVLTALLRLSYRRRNCPLYPGSPEVIIKTPAALRLFGMMVAKGDQLTTTLKEWQQASYNAADAAFRAAQGQTVSGAV